MSAPLVFLDTETTGLHPKREAWEIAMIRRFVPDNHEHEISFYIDIDDLNMAAADPMALKIGKFWERHPQSTGQRYRTSCSVLGDDDMPLTIGGERQIVHGDDPIVLTVADACKVINHFTAGAHIVGAVPNFDTEVLDGLLRRHNWLPRWHYHLVDVENLAVGYLRALLDTGNLDWVAARASELGDAIDPPWSSRELGDILGVEQIESTLHTALGDADWAKRMYDRVMT